MSKEKAPEAKIEKADEDAFYDEKAEQCFLFRLCEQGIINHD